MEIFIPFLEYEIGYEVSTYGRVKSLNYRHTGNAQIMKPKVVTKGYLAVTIFKDGKGKTIRVHRLVAIAFIPNPLNLPQVNHIDGDKKNNRVDNLEWCTNHQNSSHPNVNRKNKKTSKYVGVYRCKGRMGWTARICKDGKNSTHIGTFKTELEASNAYQKELNELLSNRGL